VTHNCGADHTKGRCTFDGAGCKTCIDTLQVFEFSDLYKIHKPPMAG
jgi:hypothetical protein